MLTFKIEPDEGEYHAWIPELPGCHTHGRTLDETIKNMKEAMLLYLEVKMEKDFTEQVLEFAK